MLLVKLLLAHLLGDFVFQPDSWAKQKSKYKLKSGKLYLHFLVHAVLVLNQWIAIGFLITAKSVLRYGDLSQSKDRKLTEYILIGTLTSFGFALETGLLISLILP